MGPGGGKEAGGRHSEAPGLSLNSLALGLRTDFLGVSTGFSSAFSFVAASVVASVERVSAVEATATAACLVSTGCGVVTEAGGTAVPDVAAGLDFAG